MGYVIRFRAMGPDAEFIEEAMQSAKNTLDAAGIPYEQHSVDAVLDNGVRAVGAGLALGEPYSDDPNVEYIWRGEDEEATSEISSFMMFDRDEDDPFVTLVSGIIDQWFALDLVDDIEMFEDDEEEDGENDE